jgi:hypothetical protein
VVPRYHIYNPALYDTEQKYYLKMGYRLMDSDGNTAAEGDATATLETTDQFIQVLRPTPTRYPSTHLMMMMMCMIRLQCAAEPQFMTGVS